MGVAKDKLREFNASVRINCEVGVTLRAKNLDEAVAAAKALTIDDIITMHGEHNDSTHWVNGVFEVGRFCSVGAE